MNIVTPFVYETWRERNGHLEDIVTDAPGGMRLVDADAYDAVVLKAHRLREALERITKVTYTGGPEYGLLLARIAINVLQEVSDETNTD